jgi:hypothetical protein
MSRKRPPIAVFFPSLVLLLAGMGLAVAALFNLAFVHTPAAVAVAAAFTVASAAMIPTALRLYGGRRSGRIATMGLLPVVAAAQFFDAFVLGGGRFPLTAGVVVPGLALICLFLPSAKAFATVPRPAAKVDVS